MSKYVFKNAEVEKAMRLVAKELGVSDEEFDKCVQHRGNCSTVFVGKDQYGNALISFSNDLLKKVKDFNPNYWNSSEVEPPRDQDDDDCSPIMLIENNDGYPSKGYFDFVKEEWRVLGTGEFIECSRYRLYPDD